MNDYPPLLELADCLIEIYSKDIIQSKEKFEESVRKDLLYFSNEHQGEENISQAKEEYEKGIRKLKKEKIMERQKLLKKIVEMRSELEKKLSIKHFLC